MTTTPAAKTTAKAAPAKRTPKAPAKAASPVTTKEAVRTSHADCTHAKTGTEGKKARAACRRERAAEAAKQAKK